LRVNVFPRAREAITWVMTEAISLHYIPSHP
jgi:hypothetical protein